MTRIGLLSDTHGYLDPAALRHLHDCDVIVHAGDFGDMSVVAALESLGKPLYGVYGNIDDAELRGRFPETALFSIEAVQILMIHIGGYPGKYTSLAKNALARHTPHLFISGHSHILKIMYDNDRQCLHMNPGAAGRQGWHQVRTMIIFDIDGSDMKNCRVIELGKRNG